MKNLSGDTAFLTDVQLGNSANIGWISAFRRKG